MPSMFDEQALQNAILQSKQTLNPGRMQAVPNDPPKDNSIGIGPYLAAGIGSGLDGLTTFNAIKNGAQEANPMLPQNPMGILGVKAAENLALQLAIKKLADSGHPTAAKILGYGGGAAFGGMALHNMNVGK